jgi:hypothetical protein
LHNRLPARTPSTSGRLPPISRTASTTGRYPARTPSSSRAPISSRPGISRDERAKRPTGGSWAYYLTIGAIAGIVIFSIVRVLTSSSASVAPAGVPDNAAAPPVAPLPPPTPLPAAKAPGIEEAPKPVLEPAVVAPSRDDSAQREGQMAPSSSASPVAGAEGGRPIAAQPEGQGIVAPSARPVRPAARAAPKSEIPSGI